MGGMRRLAEGSWWLVPVVLFTIALGLGLVRIGAKSIWYDEAVSLSYASGSFGSMWHVIVTRDSNMALYYLLLWGWVHLFGQGEAVVRALSALLAAAAPPVLYLTARRLFSTRVALLAAGLLMLQGSFLAYAQEARGYSLAMLLATVSSYLVVRARQGGSRRVWVAYALSVALGMYTHLFIALVAAAHAAWLLLERARWRTVALTYLAAGILSAPMLAFSVLNPGPAWMSKLQFDELGWTMQSFVSGTWVALALFGALVAVGTVLAVVRRDTRIAFVLLWLGVPVGVMIAGSAVRPLLVPRYLIVSLPALVLALAVTAMSIRRWLSHAAVLAVVAVSVIGLLTWYTGDPKDDWRSTTQFTAAHAAPGDAVVFYPPRMELPFDYYLARLGISAPTGMDPATARTVWVVLSYQWTGHTPPDLAALVSRLEQTHKPWGKMHRFEGVSVWRFIPRSSPTP